MLSTSLKGVVAQTLCKKKPKGRVAALEILIGNSAVASNIREGKTHQLPSVMQTGIKQGMKLLNDSLMEHVKNGVVEPLEAYIKSVDKGDMAAKLSGAGHHIDVGEEGGGGGSGGLKPAAPKPGGGGPVAPPKPKPAPLGGGGGDSTDPFEQFRKNKG
jgi:hypothetical protein